MRVLGRETFIALRARRTAFLVASEILHPPMAAPIPPPRPQPAGLRVQDLLHPDYLPRQEYLSLPPAAALPASRWDYLAMLGGVVLAAAFLIVLWSITG